MASADAAAIFFGPSMSRPPRSVNLPLDRGLSPSAVALPSQKGRWGLLLDFLAERFSAVPRAHWQARMAAGRVLDAQGQPLAPDQIFVPGARIHYYRELADEPRIPFEATVLYQDEHLLVADKPHFLPVQPAGQQVHETLLARLRESLDLPELSPLHRIDRDTAGLVLFSVQQRTRGLYQALFRERAIVKSYEALAPWRSGLEFPRSHRSRLEESPEGFRMQEVAGPPNSLTRMELLAQPNEGGIGHYRLWPVSGKRHQLRVHMAALGIPIANDPLYPSRREVLDGDFSRPLQLLARALHFVDPRTGQARSFTSEHSLTWTAPPLVAAPACGFDNAERLLISEVSHAVPRCL